MSSRSRKSINISSPTTRSTTLSSRQLQGLPRQAIRNKNDFSPSRHLQKSVNASSVADRKSYSLRNCRISVPEFKLKLCDKVRKIEKRNVKPPNVSEVVLISDQSCDSTDCESLEKESLIKKDVPVVFIVSSDDEKSENESLKKDICDGNPVIRNETQFMKNTNSRRKHLEQVNINTNSDKVTNNFKPNILGHIDSTSNSHVPNSEEKFVEQLISATCTSENENDRAGEVISNTIVSSPSDAIEISFHKACIKNTPLCFPASVDKLADILPGLKPTQDKITSSYIPIPLKTAPILVKSKFTTIKPLVDIDQNTSTSMDISLPEIPISQDQPVSLSLETSPQIPPPLGVFSTSGSEKISPSRIVAQKIVTVTEVDASSPNLNLPKEIGIIENDSRKADVSKLRSDKIIPESPDLSQLEENTCSSQVVSNQKPSNISSMELDTGDKETKECFAENPDIALDDKHVHELTDVKSVNECGSLEGSVAEGPTSSDSRSSNSSSHLEDDFYSPGSTDLSMSEESRSSFLEGGAQVSLENSASSRPKQRNRSKNRSSRRKKRQQLQQTIPQGLRSLSVSEEGSLEHIQGMAVASKRGKRLPYRSGILWEIGQRLEAMDFQSMWYPAKIVEVDEEACEILIHFEGWSIRYDEWVRMDSVKLRAPTTANPRGATDKDQHTSKTKVFKVKEKVLARWNDGKLYEATIKQVYPDTHYGVIFYDGFSKKLPLSAIRKNSKSRTDKATMPPHISPKKVNSLRKRPFAKLSQSEPAAEEDDTPVVKRAVSRSTVPTFSARDTPSAIADSLITTAATTVASKQFVVETDHNQYKCSFKDCTKGFRKESLLQSHMKHYHHCSSVDIGEQLMWGPSSVSGERGTPSPITGAFPVSDTDKKSSIKVRSRNVSAQQKTVPALVSADIAAAGTVEESAPSSSEESQSCSSKTESSPETAREEENALMAAQMLSNNEETKILEIKTEMNSGSFASDPETVTKEIAIPTAQQFKTFKTIKTSPRKEVYPITKMETRHAKPCLFREDSIYTGYMSYRSLYAKSGKGSRKSSELEGKRRRSRVQEEECKGEGESKRGKRKQQDGGSKPEATKRCKMEYPDIDEEIAEMKKRRTERFSESSVKTDDTTRESLDLDAEDDEENISEEGEQADDEIVRCICRNEEENGLMFQCEDCKTWQHAACFDIENEEDVPETYFCYICTRKKVEQPTPDRMQELEEDTWLTKGELPVFAFPSVQKTSSTCSNRPMAVQASHQLMNSVQTALEVLSSLQHKIHLAKSDNHPDLKMWSHRWKPRNTVSGNEMRVPTFTVTSSDVLSSGQSCSGNMQQSEAPSAVEDFLVFDHSYFSTSDQALGIQEEVVIEESPVQSPSLEIPLGEDSTLISPAAAASQPDSEEPKTSDKMGEPQFLYSVSQSGDHKGAATIKEEKKEVGKEEGGEVDLELCRVHLLEHINSVQEDLDGGLDFIERQLNLLEADLVSNECSKNEDKTLNKLLASVKGLSRDLGVVHRFTLLQ